MLDSKTKAETNLQADTSRVACPKCAGFVIVITEDIRCLNCGWCGFTRTTIASPQKELSEEAGGFKTITTCQLDTKHGKVSVTTRIANTYQISLHGHRDAFSRWNSLKSKTIEHRLYKLLNAQFPSRPGVRRCRGLSLSASDRTIAFLKRLDRERVKTHLCNIFAFPFCHGYLRINAPRGASSDPGRILFWQTARDISHPLRCWLDKRSQSDTDYAKLRRLLQKKCGRVTDDLIIRYLIDLNWRNAGLTFPDKPALENRQTSRYLSQRTDLHFPQEYVFARSWRTDGKGPDLYLAINKNHPDFPSGMCGRILVQEFLNGRYIVRSRSVRSTVLHPSL